MNTEISKVVAEIRAYVDGGDVAEIDRLALWADRLTRAQQEAEPVAWGVAADGIRDPFLYVEYSRDAAERASCHALNPRIVPLYAAPQPRIDLAQLKADVPRYTVKVERDGNAWMSVAMKHEAGEWCRWADIEKAIFYTALIAGQEARNV